MNRKKEIKMNVLGGCSFGKGCFLVLRKGKIISNESVYISIGIRNSVDKYKWF